MNIELPTDLGDDLLRVSRELGIPPDSLVAANLRASIRDFWRQRLQPSAPRTSPLVVVPVHAGGKVGARNRAS